MTNHIGEIIRIATSYARGAINDHVEVLCTSSGQPETYSAYARSGYNVGKGPEERPRYDGDLFQVKLLDEGESPRGWRHIDPVCSDVSLDEALTLAEAEARKRNTVLYLDDLNTPGPEVKWHPDGWEPVEG